MVRNQKLETNGETNIARGAWDMSEIFKTDKYSPELIDWLTGTGEAIDEEGHNLPDNFSNRFLLPTIGDIESWRVTPTKQWRLPAMNERGVAKYAALLAQMIEGCSFYDSFEVKLEDSRGLIASLDEFSRPASHSEIADALATLADVLDQSIPDAMASFIIEEIAAEGAPSAAAWRICRHIAANESGRIKPSLFVKFLATISNRRSNFRDDIREFVEIHKCFDEALAMALENEPTLMTG
jgi:hypothetical protein